MPGYPSGYWMVVLNAVGNTEELWREQIRLLDLN